MGGSEAGDGVEAPDSPLAKQHSGGLRGSATTSIPGSPSEDTAAAAAEASTRSDAGGEPAAEFQTAQTSDAATLADQQDEAASDGGSIYPDSDDEAVGGGSFVIRDGDANAQPEDPQQQLKQALARIAQLEDQNVALWQVGSF